MHQQRQLWSHCHGRPFEERITNKFQGSVCVAVSVVFVGGSLIRRGGHNILEPAACGKPVLFGPWMENFKGSVRVLVGRGGIQVPDTTRLQKVLADLLSRPEEIDKLGKLAREAVTTVQGASQACAEAIVAAAQKEKP